MAYDAKLDGRIRKVVAASVISGFWCVGLSDMRGPLSRAAGKVKVAEGSSFICPRGDELGPSVS